MKKLLLILLLLPINLLAGSFGNELGDTASTSAMECKDVINAGVFICDATGSLDSIMVYSWNQGPTSVNWKCAVLRRSDGTIIDSTYITEISSDIHYLYRTFTFVNGATVKQDTSYYLCVWTDSLGTVPEGYYGRVKRSSSESIGDTVKLYVRDFANQWATTTSWTTTLNDYYLCIRAFTTSGSPPAVTSTKKTGKVNLREFEL